MPEALRDDPRRLYVLFMGPITDMACAVLEHPEIEDRLTVIWNGGGAYPEGGLEFNVSNDIQAANIMMRSGVELWQISADCVSMVVTSLSELECKIRPRGKVGRYLFEQLVAFHDSIYDHWTSGETWGSGDSCTIGVLMHHNQYQYITTEAPSFHEDMTYQRDTGWRKIRVYQKIDSRLILEDMYSKMALCYPGRKAMKGCDPLRQGRSDSARQRTRLSSDEKRVFVV